MSSKPIFGNWMVAIAEAAELAGAPDLEQATAEQLVQAWEIVGRTADLEPDELAAAVAEEKGLPLADLPGRDPRAEILIPGDVARRWLVVPLGCTQRDVSVATANPMNEEARREIDRYTGRNVLFHVTPPAPLEELVTDVYGPITEEDRPDRRSRESEPPSGPHVLVVDDEAGQRALLRSLLEEAGYRVTTAPDGPGALEVLDGDAEIDLVTLDYWMDKMNGLRVLQRIRAAQDPATAGLPIIVVTGSDDRRIEMSLFEAGADDYIAKPIDGPLFLLRVQAVLRRRRAV